MAAHQAPPSLGFSRQEHWSGLPFPSPVIKVKSASEVAQSCPTLSNPMHCSPPGSSVHGICQARVLEWGAIAFWATYDYLVYKQKLVCDAEEAAWLSGQESRAALTGMNSSFFPMKSYLLISPGLSFIICKTRQYIPHRIAMKLNELC